MKLRILKRNIKNVWEETARTDEEENHQVNDKTIGIYKDQGYRSECERVLYTRRDC